MNIQNPRLLASSTTSCVTPVGFYPHRRRNRRVRAQDSGDDAGRRRASEDHAAVGQQIGRAILRSDDARDGHVAIVTAELCERDTDNHGVALDLEWHPRSRATP